MEEQKTAISPDIKLVAAKIFQLSFFVGLAVLAPYFQNQLITGSVVNALLFISAGVLGAGPALLLCSIPSLISLYTGFLPLALAPMIVFIMIGNALLVLTFLKLNKKGFWAGAFAAAAVKYIFIFSAGKILAGTVLQGVQKNVLLMISWPQLATAIMGACAAYLFFNIIKIKK